MERIQSDIVLLKARRWAEMLARFNIYIATENGGNLKRIRICWMIYSGRDDAESVKRNKTL